MCIYRYRYRYSKTAVCFRFLLCLPHTVTHDRFSNTCNYQDKVDIKNIFIFTEKKKDFSKEFKSKNVLQFSPVSIILPKSLPIPPAISPSSHQMPSTVTLLWVHLHTCPTLSNHTALSPEATSPVPHSAIVPSVYKPAIFLLFLCGL